MKFIDNEFAKVEDAIRSDTDRESLLRSLREVGLDDFGQLLFSMPNDRYPRMSGLLPAMASDQVQRNWTGTSGPHLLRQTLDFVRSVCYNFARLSGSALDDKVVLDFGCGYGRIARLFYYFVEPANFYGVDPWDESIRLCAESGLTQNFLVSDYLPVELPTGTTAFDLIYAFSVFTHLSERATRTSIDTLLRRLTPNGILTITIRPPEYWEVDQYAQARGKVPEMLEAHRTAGFAFMPHDRPPIDGDVTYGDTSISLDWIRQVFPEARIRGIDRSLEDPYQIYVFLSRSNAEPRSQS